ncbi:MAG: hypothetical protein AAGG68_30060, partial [Bacteroidota bacterium]
IYNRKFDFFEDDNFINAKMKEYFEYESWINKVRHEKELPPKTKQETQVVHDIKLRESIIYLRDKINDENELRYIGITLDNQLLRFDRYLSTKKLRKKSSVIQPNFISPTNFLRRIRAFLPIQTDDYRRAFISAMTSLPTTTGTNEKSITIQRSVSYFHSIGIEDEQAILNIVKNEVLYNQLQSYKEEEKRNLFIQAEVDKYLKELKIQNEQLSDEKNKEVSDLKNALDKKNKEKNLLENSNKKKDIEIKESRSAIEALNNQMIKLATKIEKSEYEKKMNQYITSKWSKDEKIYRSNRRTLFWLSLFMIIPILSLPVLNHYSTKISELLPNIKLFWIQFLVIFLGAIGLIIRTFMDKKNVTKGFKFFIAKLSGKRFSKFREDHYCQYKTEFAQNNNALSSKALESTL